MPGKASKGSHPGGILTRCLLRASWMSELLTSSLRLSPATKQKKLILYLHFHSFSHYPEFMTAGEGWNVGRLANWKLCLPSQLLHHHNKTTHSPIFPSLMNKTLRYLQISDTGFLNMGILWLNIMDHEWNMLKPVQLNLKYRQRLIYLALETNAREPNGRGIFFNNLN